MDDIPFLVTFHFKWHSILSEITFWVTFHFESYSILSDIPFWVIFHFKWKSIWSDCLVSQSQWLELRWYRSVNFQSVCLWVSERSADLEMLAHLKRKVWTLKTRMILKLKLVSCLSGKKMKMSPETQRKRSARKVKLSGTGTNQFISRYK